MPRPLTLLARACPLHSENGSDTQCASPSQRKDEAKAGEVEALVAKLASSQQEVEGLRNELAMARGQRGVREVKGAQRVHWPAHMLLEALDSRPVGEAEAGLKEELRRARGELEDLNRRMEMRVQDFERWVGPAWGTCLTPSCTHCCRGICWDKTPEDMMYQSMRLLRI